MGRLKWLQRNISHFSLSRAWRWYYRLGFRKGKMRGIEIGRQQQVQHFHVNNRCVPCARDMYPQVVDIAGWGPVEVWVCPNWQAHTLYIPDMERSTDKVARPLQTYIQERHAGSGIHTACTKAIPRQATQPFMLPRKEEI